MKKWITINRKTQSGYDYNVNLKIKGVKNNPLLYSPPGLVERGFVFLTSYTELT